MAPVLNGHYHDKGLQYNSIPVHRKTQDHRRIYCRYNVLLDLYQLLLCRYSAQLAKNTPDKSKGEEYCRRTVHVSVRLSHKYRLVLWFYL